MSGSGCSGFANLISEVRHTQFCLAWPYEVVNSPRNTLEKKIIQPILKLLKLCCVMVSFRNDQN